ncbi:hypothetical protein BV25DRAFT_1901436 [Artomyces pyxidatus]|uniref:Uncharacterized protein n=1 Tax=Artomyces pyxidatus TaxID=48021 RepID=A0ACB8SUA2_9AGAM|nr:hypothetical protein BV25DRAFT_1901436 [Artomyces pyxidatus]
MHTAANARLLLFLAILSRVSITFTHTVNELFATYSSPRPAPQHARPSGGALPTDGKTTAKQLAGTEPHETHAKRKHMQSTRTHHSHTPPRRKAHAHNKGAASQHPTRNTPDKRETPPILSSTLNGAFTNCNLPNRTRLRGRLEADRRFRSVLLQSTTPPSATAYLVIREPTLSSHPKHTDTKMYLVHNEVQALASTLAYGD